MTCMADIHILELINKTETEFLHGFKTKERRVSQDVRKNFVNRNKKCETLMQAAQRSCGCPLPGGTQDQIGCGPGQTDLGGATLLPAEDWNWVIFKTPSKPGHSVIL